MRQLNLTKTANLKALEETSPVQSGPQKSYHKAPSPKQYHLVVTHVGMKSPDIYSLTYDELKAKLNAEIEIAERLLDGDGVYLFTGKWIDPIINFKKIITSFDLTNECDWYDPLSDK
jgi:hypothetical protein